MTGSIVDASEKPMNKADAPQHLEFIFYYK